MEPASRCNDQQECEWQSSANKAFHLTGAAFRIYNIYR
jgi:hypothetical protein